MVDSTVAVLDSTSTVVLGSIGDWMIKKNNSPFVFSVEQFTSTVQTSHLKAASLSITQLKLFCHWDKYICVNKSE